MIISFQGVKPIAGVRVISAGNEIVYEALI